MAKREKKTEVSEKTGQTGERPSPFFSGARTFALAISGGSQEFADSIEYGAVPEAFQRFIEDAWAEWQD